MTTGHRIETEEAFHERLHEVVTVAAANGVDVEGAWPVLHEGGDAPDWDLEIVALTDSSG
jgi:hypothetical protein